MIGAQFYPFLAQFHQKKRFLRNVSAGPFSCSYQNIKVDLDGTFQSSFALERCFLPCLAISSSRKSDIVFATRNVREEDHLNADSEKAYQKSFIKSISNLDEKEVQRRAKIGVANKGKAPWNKGKSHSVETRKRIKERTLEALKDPEVKKKMSGRPRSHTDQSKARIGISLRRIWRERFNQKRKREIAYVKWAECIAETAKIGGHDQEELDWDSYEKMKVNIALRQLQLDANKAKAKELAMIRAEIEAKAKTERRRRLAERQKQGCKRTENISESNRKTKTKSESERKDDSIGKGLRLKSKINKIYLKKSTEVSVNSHVNMSASTGTAVEEWDVEFIRSENMRKGVSFADQIRAAKEKKLNLQ